MLGDQFNNVFTFDHFFDAGFEDKFNVIVFVKDYSNKLDLNAVFQRIISNLLIVKRQINEGYISFLNIYYDSFFKNSYGQVIDEVIAFLLDREELIKSSGELNFSLL